KQGTTDSDGKIDFGRLLFGNYIIEEVKAPEGYEIETKSKLITINKEFTSNDEDVHEYTVGNYKPVYMIELTKTDSASGDFLPGAEFKVYDAQTGGSEVGTGGATDGNGKLFIKDLPKDEGAYYIQEVKPSEDIYQMESERYKVEI